MLPRFPIRLLPRNEVIEAPAGTALSDLLAPHGVEFPCGGQSQCGGCRVRVLAGEIPVTPEMRACLRASEIDSGWRLACFARLAGPLTLEVGQWETSILSDDAVLPAESAPGYGIAVDIGTTTLVAQLLHRSSGNVLAVASALNPQTVHGADIMSRVQFAVAAQPQRLRLTALIRTGIGELIRELLAARPESQHDVAEVLLAGNTVMHHLFCGIDPEPLSHVPFDPSELGARIFAPEELGWLLPPSCRIEFLPNLGGFVGSDILAGILAAGMHEADGITALMDLGTNGEIVLGNRERLLCASTAAGPAFEAGRISAGMRAATGAITQVHVRYGELHCHVLGGGAARGICGSGLVDAVACGLALQWIQPGGRLVPSRRDLTLLPSVSLTQKDIRELQLAKAAVAAGLRILTAQIGIGMSAIHCLHLAGAFGNYVNVESGRRIGLLEMDPARIHPAGNTALRGAKMLLLAPSRRAAVTSRIRSLTTHIPLATDPLFQEIYVDCMGFPPAAESPAVI